jgi:hypothetical protein
LVTPASAPQIALEEVRGRTGVLVRGSAAPAASVVVKRSSYISIGTERTSCSASTNASVLACLLPTLAAKRQRQPDDDALDVLLAHDRLEPREAVLVEARSTTPTGAAIVPVASEMATPVRAAP